MNHSTPPAANDEVHLAPTRAGGVEQPTHDAVPGLELGTQIAEWMFSRVYRAKSPTPEGYEEPLAVKIWKGGTKPWNGSKTLCAALLELRHVNVIRHVSEGTTSEGAAYVAMEYAQGQTLADLLKHGPIEVSRAVGISRQLARALVALHGANLVHGDLKPNHIVVVEDERYEDQIKVCDIGAKPLDWVKTRLEESTWVKRRAYLAPEQLEGDIVTQRSDLYGAGAILFEMLTGSALSDDQPASKLVAQLPRYVPRALKDVVLRLIQKEPSLRFSSAEQWLTALDQIDGRAQDEDEMLSSSPRSAFIASGMSRTAPPGSVRPASSIRRAPWGLDAGGFKLWAVACLLAAAGAAGIVGYRMYTHSDPHAVNQSPIGQTTNAQKSSLQSPDEILRTPAGNRSTDEWLTLTGHLLDRSQPEQAENALEQAVRQDASVVRGSRAGLLVRRLGERRGAFLTRLEGDVTLTPEVRLWARNNQ